MHSSTLLVALSLSLSLSFSLSLAAASSSHNSHRHIRSLPRSPRRLDTHHKQQATTTSSSSSSSSNTNNNGLPAIVEGPFTGGKATFYNQYGVAGACGKVNSDDALIVALQIDRYGSGSNNAPDCGRTVVVTNTANGKSVVATVADACPGCENENSLDLSIGAFGKIGDYDTGVLSISWYFAS
ncbi:barwin-like endoglucanase [Meredithblackwellia eburnea MCA 4105]